jgi:hypothetical protein
MIFGYLIGALPLRTSSMASIRDNSFSLNRFRVLLLVAFFAFLVGHKNITMSDSLIPYDFVSDVVSGLIDSQIQYVAKIDRLDSYSGSKVLNVLNFFVAFSKIALIPIVIFYWGKLKLFDKFFALVISFLPVLSGVSMGTNKPLFDFVILYGSSLFLYFVSNYYKIGKCDFRSRRVFVISICICFVASLWFFGAAMLGRGGDPTYVESTSPLGHIRVADQYRAVGDDEFLSYLYVWLSNYLVQGYYGFSQAFNVDFDSTFGFGNSQFLTRQVEWLSGVDLSVLTYQHKIDRVWNETAQWHSLYSYLANDFGFLGVGVWNFFSGLYLAKVWKSFLDEDNFYSKVLLPLFILMVIFTPANNQVFGFLETFSAFLFFSLFWFARIYRR